MLVYLEFKKHISRWNRSQHCNALMNRTDMILRSTCHCLTPAKPVNSPSVVYVADSQVAGLDKNRKEREGEGERDGEREAKQQRKVADPKLLSKNMDPEVWGKLPSNLALEIYKWLPMRSFYQLRVVCKDWNLVAGERRWVTDPMPKPYFMLVLDGDDEFGKHVDEETDDEYYEPRSAREELRNVEDEDDEEADYEGEEEDEEVDDFDEDHEEHYLHGQLAFHIKADHTESGGWRWQKLHTIPVNYKLLYKAFSVKGMTFSRDLPVRRRTYGVFDAHTRKRYSVPRQPKTSKLSRALGMTVDTSVVPHTFKIILGSLDLGTQIYDSVTNSWETKSSLLVPCKESQFKTCLHCGSYMYIWFELDNILVYSLEADQWSTLDPPLRAVRNLNEQLIKIRECLGFWQGRMYAVTSDTQGYIYPLLWVWELVEGTHWIKVDEMPSDIHEWLIAPRIREYTDIYVFASFSDELVMIYSWVPKERRAYRFVLYNLATKKWKKVKAPDHSVSVTSDDEKDVEKWNVRDPKQDLSDADVSDGVMSPSMSNYGDDSEEDYFDESWF